MPENESPKIPENDFDVEYGLQLYLKSFKHSQGDPYLQDHILYYYAELHPGWRITDDQVKEIYSKAKGPALSINNVNDPKKLRPHITKNEGDVEYELTTHLRSFQQALSDRPHHLSTEERMKYITREFLERELLYMDRGRPNRKGTSADPYFSYYQHYIVEKNPTGHVELDKMYQEIGKYLKQDNKDLVQMLEDKYKERHPDS